MPWFRGNLHTHTTNSDGDSSPDAVVAWYRDAGYDFLALTDHDLLTLPSDHAATAGPMLLIHGEEVSSEDLHVNALGIRRTIAPAAMTSVTDTLQENVEAIVAAAGVASVNHPNYRWLVTADDLSRLQGCSLFEVYNAGPETNNFGGPGRPSAEALWDAVLSRGRRLRAIAVDDAHHFRAFGHRYSNPGRAWIHVQASHLSEAAILEAVETGEMYASTGVELEDVKAAADEVAVTVMAEHDRTYRTSIIGPNGSILEQIDGPDIRFRVSGSVPYARARVDDSDGQHAWLQPFYPA